MRREVPLGDATDLYSRRWRRVVRWGKGARHFVRQRYHRQERQAGKRQARDAD